MVIASALHGDVLWKVFNIIADAGIRTNPRYNTPSSLRTLRFASQTCGTWRDILLSSPSIWGKCFDLDNLLTHDEHWMKEVIRRTGDAPLYVKRCQNYSKCENLLTGNFLKDNWYRICSLNLAVSIQLTKTLLDLEVLSLPAPNMISCILYFTGHGVLSVPRAVLLRGETPCLRELEITCDGRFPQMFILSTNHLSQLRSMEIGPVCDPTDLLQNLSSTSLLERLKIELDFRHINCDYKSRNRSRVFRAVSSKKVTLPCLKELVVRVENALGAAVTILDDLDMTTGFALCFESSTDIALRSEDVDRLARILAVYLSYRQPVLPTNGETVRLEYYGSFRVTYRPIGLSFFVQDGLDAGGMISLLQSLMGATCLHGAMSLALDSWPFDDPVRECVRDILASFTSVARLVVGENDFADIIRWSREANGRGELLPALERLRIGRPHGITSSSGLAHEVMLKQFAENRIARRGKSLTARYYSSVLNIYRLSQFDSQV
ncbi:hypothetical protein CPC08DRAFT_752498 [Agrocybe pediades]|nr:hypothetical protein CPC08DRAFT_752498 [Agrocybe pediades]